MTEILGSVLLVALPDHLAGGDVERFKQVGRSGSDVVGGPPFGLPEIHRQDRLSTFERLDLRLLVDAQHDRVGWRAHVERDGVANLLDEQRVLRQPDGLGPMRLQAERAPDPADRRVAHSDVLRHRASAPMRPPARRLLERLGYHCLDRVIGDLANCTGPGLVMQSIETLCDEPRPPFADAATMAAKRTRDLLV